MKLFQRIFGIFLSLCLAFPLIACGKKPQTPAPTTAPTEITVPTSAPTEITTVPTEATAEASAPATEASVPASEASTPTETTGTGKPVQTAKPTVTAPKTKPTVATKATAAATKPAATTIPATRPSATAAPTTQPTAATTKVTAATTAPTAAATQPATLFPLDKVIVDTTGMTDLQKAIVVTAECYYLRGKWAQYDQYALTKMSSNNVNRRYLGIMAPEDYTSQHYGYTDCSSFVYDVYCFALGMSISTPANTKTYCAGSPYTILTETPKQSGFANMTADELAAKEKAFRDTLQPGDIIVYRAANGNSGHAMLYVGSNYMIHSSGSTYDFSAGTDKVEKYGTYAHDPIDVLFSAGNRRYLFDKSVYVILRPLNKFYDEIPQHTLQRMDIMRGIVAEKLCSHTYGQTVTPGDTITYTIQVKNKTIRPITLPLTDTVPAGTTYVSGGNTVSGDQVSWKLSVPAGATVTVSYTVQVNASTPAGTYIQSEGSIGGVPLKCQRVMVGRTLTADEQQAVLDAQKELAGGGLKGVELLNAIYQKACGKSVFTAADTDALWADLVSPFNGDNFCLDTEKLLTTLVAPRLYGGKLMGEPENDAAHTQYRTRLVTKNVLMIGDVVLADDKLYLFTGAGLYNLSLGASGGLYSHEALLCNDRFVVLRPSLAWN